MPPLALVVCQSKLGYASHKQAVAVLRMQVRRADRLKRDRSPLNVYRCGVCALYHIGNADADRTHALKTPRRHDDRRS